MGYMRLELKDLRKNFGEKEVLKGISFSVESGRATGLLGRNGAGKTTTIRIIMGIFKADSGEILVDGVPMEKAKIKVGYMPEERGLYPKKNILDQMVYFGMLRGLTSREAKQRAEDLLTQLDASEYLDKRLDVLSKGNQQKIQLAIAVINDPDIIILDEPLSGLDPVNATRLKEMIENLVARNKVVLFSSHQMDYVEEFCQHICIVRSGELVLNGDLREIKKGYPRNKILVIPEITDKFTDNGFMANFQNAVGNLAENISPRQNGGFICTLRNENDRHKIIPILAENNILLERFEVMEPTLGEIFVEKAGGIKTNGAV